MSLSETNSAISTFAEELRRAREFKRVTVKEVAEATKIQKSFLEAIESGHWEDVPSAYLRGYVAQFATVVGMNSEKVLAQFDAIHASDSARAAVHVESESPFIKRPQHVELTRSRIRAGWFVVIYRNRWLAYGLSAVLVLAGYYGVKYSRPGISFEVTPVEFDEAIAETAARLYSPFHSIVFANDSVESRLDKPKPDLLLVAGQSCAVYFSLNGRPHGFVEAGAFDTLMIPKREDLQLSVVPAGSALMYTRDFVPVPSTGASGDTTKFDLGASGSASFAQTLETTEQKMPVESGP